jgi:hypothetical protein
MVAVLHTSLPTFYFLLQNISHEINEYLDGRDSEQPKLTCISIAKLSKFYIIDPRYRREGKKKKRGYGWTGVA